MSLGTTLGSLLVSRRGPNDGLLGGNGDGKPEGYYLGKTMGVGFYIIFFGVSG